MNLSALQISDTLVPYKRSALEAFLEELTAGIPNSNLITSTIVDEVELTLFDNIEVDQLLDSAILVATQNIQNDINFDKVGARILLTKVYREALKGYQDAQDFDAFYQKSFKRYLNYSYENNLLNIEMRDTGFNLKRLTKALIPSNDDIFKFIGLSTALKRYMKLDWNQKPLETPQFMWMRIAMWLSINEENKEEAAIQFYHKLSNLEYIPGGSTNIGAGTNYPVLSNCYLIDTEDDIHSIFDNVKNVAMISKATGGIGISITKLRAAGSPVKSNNTFSTGPIPFIKVMDTALKSVSRAGKKAGAMCIYMENWHIDFPDFLDLRQNAGDDYRRIRTANTAVYISDEFMKRVINNETWYMFDPYETPELAELYGNEFSKKYQEYCEKADNGELNLVKAIPAREQMKRIMASLLGTSHPWLTWKDNINLRALNNNTGTIHSSNLCTEICLPQDRENIAVCNLAYVNLTQHIISSEDGDKAKARVDWTRLEDTVRVTQRHLDNLIDVNSLNVKEAKKSDTENRAVGMGMSGLAESLELLGYPYDSKEAFDFMDEVMEFITYHSIDESCNLAEERGAYTHFEGSMWSKGYVPYDTIEKVALDREGENYSDDNLPISGINDTKQSEVSPLAKIKVQIEEKLSQTKNEDSKDLYAIFDQLTDYIDKTNKELESLKQDTGSTQNSVGNELESEESLLQPGKGIALRQDRSFRLDWDLLRKRVQNGIRNATTMAIAPNASTGLVLGTTPGIDIRFAQIFSRNTSTGNFLDINHNLVKDLQRIGLWEKVKDQVLAKFGDISEIEEIPENLRRLYKTSFQVSPYAAIEVASRAQKWIDQAMSRNMYLQTRDVDELIDIYTEAWRRGIKTTYYLHTKPRHKAEQSTVKVNKRESLNKVGFSATTSNISTSTTTMDQHNNKQTSQTSFNNTPEKKGFGFAADNKVEKDISAIQEVAQREEVVAESISSGGNSGGGFKGFGGVSVKAEKVNFKKPVVDFAACPLDPAERANCEACQ